MFGRYVFLILLSLISGFAGAYFFQSTLVSKEPTAIPASQHAVPNSNSLVTPTFLASSRQNGEGETIPMDFVMASERSTRSVVYIKTTVKGRVQMDWLDFFFQGGREQQVISSGSGVIFSKDGYIITNHHVIDGASQIQVIHERSLYEAKVIGKDPSTDLALLKIEAENLPAAAIGSSRKLKVGEWVIAVGNPFNLTSTVTAGIVSAKGRNINILNSQFPIESFIQTDAAINPGNSGGALVNIEGELVGINTAILSRTGSYAGYGFAVPVDIVAKVASDFREYGEIQKAFLGAKVMEFDSKFAEQNKLKILNGVVISYLDSEGSAEKAGLQQNDVIVEISGSSINSQAEFDEQLSYYRPGDAVEIKVNRSGQILSKKVTLSNRLGTFNILRRMIVPAPEIGADIEELSKEELKKLNLNAGIRVLNLSNGLLSRIGIEEGFVIISINKVILNDAKEAIQVLKNMRGRIVLEGMTSNGVRGYYSLYL
jgi:serine protease Do